MTICISLNKTYVIMFSSCLIELNQHKDKTSESSWTLTMFYMRDNCCQNKVCLPQFLNKSHKHITFINRDSSRAANNDFFIWIVIIYCIPERSGFPKNTYFVNLSDLLSSFAIFKGFHVLNI